MNPPPTAPPPESSPATEAGSTGVARRKRRRPGRRLRYLLEYVGIRCGRGLIRFLPPRVGIALASGLATLAFPLMHRRRAIAMDNILQAGITADPAVARRIARDSFRHFTIMMVESILAERVITAENWTEHVDTREAGPLMSLVKEPGLGLILATAHFGNWEVPAQVLTQFKPMVALARRMNNPYTDGLVQQRKLEHEFRTILKHEARAATLMEVLRAGNLLAMVIDQHARYRGMLIPFMGRPAATNTAAAILHLRSGAPMCFAYCIRTGPLRYRLVCSRIFQREAQRETGEAGILQVMEAITHCLEVAIRETPEQYLWAHRRWRAGSSHRLRIPEKYASLAAGLNTH